MKRVLGVLLILAGTALSFGPGDAMAAATPTQGTTPVGYQLCTGACGEEYPLRNWYCPINQHCYLNCTVVPYQYTCISLP